MEPDRALRQSILGDEAAPKQRAARTPRASAAPLETPQRSIWAEWRRRLIVRLVLSLLVIVAGREWLQSDHGQAMQSMVVQEVTRIVLEETAARQQASLSASEGLLIAID